MGAGCAADGRDIGLPGHGQYHRREQRVGRRRGRHPPDRGAGTFSDKTADYYAPYNWQDLDNGDTDLGGASEVLFDMPGTSTPHLVAAGGKDGHLYLLDRDNLGGAAATQAADAALFNETMATNQFKGSPVAYTTTKGTYVAFHVEGGSGNGLPRRAGG